MESRSRVLPAENRASGADVPIKASLRAQGEVAEDVSGRVAAGGI